MPHIRRLVIGSYEVSSVGGGVHEVRGGYM